MNSDKKAKLYGRIAWALATLAYIYFAYDYIEGLKG